MRKFDSVYLVFLLGMTLSLTGCQAIADIFQAGVWAGVVIVLLILGLVWLLFGRGGRK